MSLEFKGYSADVLLEGKEVGHGFSEVGPACSPLQAVLEAIKQAKVVFDTAGSDWRTTYNLQVVVHVETGMPTSY